MKNVKNSLLFVLTLVILLGCGKEKSIESPIKNPAAGSLKSSQTGDCNPINVKGTYKVNTNLGDTNYVDIEVMVTKAGSYTISTDTANGYSFSASGVFATAGVNQVRLKGSGRPALPGVDDFIVLFDTSLCFFTVNVLPGSGNPPPSGPAVFTLTTGQGGACNATPGGSFVLNTALNSSNIITLGVNVTTAGSYTITTGPINGMTFSGTGSFSNTGNQTVVLTGTGTPTAAGAANFSVTAGSSTCTFNVTVSSTPPPVLPGDYYPRTANSNWTYEFNDGADDTLLRKVIAPTHSALGNTYNIFMSTDDVTMGFDTAGYIRKAGANYYEFSNMGDYYGFDNPLWAEYLILKEDQAAGHSWTSASFTGSVMNISFTFREKLTILQKNVSVTVNGIAYNNVIVVEQRTEQNTGVGWMDRSQVDGYTKVYYAKGIGIIKYEFLEPAGTVSDKLELTRHVVF